MSIGQESTIEYNVQETSVKQMSSTLINGFESEQTSRRKIIIIAKQEGTKASTISCKLYKIFR